MKWSNFPRLTTGNQLNEYFFGNDIPRAYSHGQYCHYTRLESLNSILKNKSIHLGCVLGFNDEIDKRQFGNIDEQVLY